MTLTSIIGQPSVNRLRSYAANPERGSRCFLLDGPPGTGKTSSAYALAEMLGVTDNAPLLVEDVSSNLSVDRVEELFFRTFRLSFPWKCWIIDELDSLPSKQAEKELKSALDEKKMPSRLTVIATTNDAKNLPPAILNRFTLLPYPGDATFARAARTYLATQWALQANGKPLPSTWIRWGDIGESFSMRSALQALRDHLEDAS